MSELPMLIKRALVFGLPISPYMLSGVLKEYEKKKIPDEILSSLRKESIKMYIDALYDCSREEASYWSRGHDILINTFDFKRVEKVEGHRTFVSLEFVGADDE